jgi:gentisate 1,2-dioxygenase
MATALQNDYETVESLQDLYPRLSAMSACPGWNKPTASLWAQPKKNFKPMQWRWEEGRAALTAAGRLISTELADRRNLMLFNPVEGNGYATLRTLVSAYQMILPGEKARSHRHSGNALRLMLEGEGSYTVVQGERLEMRPNDVLLTPDWLWHGHGNDGDAPGYWIDALDVPLVHLLEPMFFQPHPDGFETAIVAPKTSPFIFAWDDVQASLDKTPKDPEGLYGRRVELGAPAMVTTALHMQRHEGGARTRQSRTTANQIFCVVEGRGRTIVDGQTFPWARGDVIAVPGWRPFEHQVDSDATLFSISDSPVLKAFNWLRSEVLP